MFQREKNIKPPICNVAQIDRIFNGLTLEWYITLETFAEQESTSVWHVDPSSIK